MNEKIIALMGNPNVGKSTLFNNLTHLHQHTGNWTGKTVESASGKFKTAKDSYTLVDLPGTYSLLAHSQEEEVARDFLLSGSAFLTIVVCDALCLSRGLNLVYQTLEITKNVIVCINFLGEAKKRGIKIDIKALSQTLSLPVIPIEAKSKKTLKKLTDCIDNAFCERINFSPKLSKYPMHIETAIETLSLIIKEKWGENLPCRWISLKLLCKDASALNNINKIYNITPLYDGEVLFTISRITSNLSKEKRNELYGTVASSQTLFAKNTAEKCTRKEEKNPMDFFKIDRIVTGKFLSFPIMLCLLVLVFWITIVFANYPSQLLILLFSSIGEKFSEFLSFISVPPILKSFLFDGVYKVLTSVVSVMLPPMMIFFPLFTILEDLGYLPRVAFNLDSPFERCGACGKQSLTMCMGFGCNAVGVTGCRIIDSPRERLAAILTNCFVPCNGRFPMLITIITIFLSSNSLYSAALLSLFVSIGIGATFLTTRFLTKTFLKGAPSSFILELPPYRKPEIVKTLIRSIFDRTVFVLMRAVCVAIPAGAVIWLLANIKCGGTSLILIASQFLDPFAKIIGLDGVILLSFILGFPANEIVVPIMLMCYLSTGSLSDIESISVMRSVFQDNGWTVLTAINVLLFSILHFPCATTLLTIKKETGSLKWTLLSFVLPTLVGIIACFITTVLYNLVF